MCIPLPRTLTLPQAAATGVGILTAAQGVFDLLGVPIPDPTKLPAAGSRDEWVLVFGGAGSAGQFAVQLLRVAGFKVVTTSSAKSFDVCAPLPLDAMGSLTGQCSC